MAETKIIEPSLTSNRHPSHKDDNSEDSLRLSVPGNNGSLSDTGDAFRVSFEDFHDASNILTVDFILKQRKKIKNLLETEVSEKSIDESFNDWWQSVYLLAAFAGCTDIVSLLLDRGVFVDLPSLKGDTALHFAASAGHYKIVKLLLENGCSPYLLDANGKTPLCLAIENGHQRVITLLAQIYDVIPEMEILNESSDADLYKKICEVIEKTVRLETRREFRAHNRAKEHVAKLEEVIWSKREEKQNPCGEKVKKRRSRKQRTKTRCVVGFNLENVTNDVYEFVADRITRREKMDSKATHWVPGCQISEELLKYLTFLSRGGEPCLHVASKLGLAEVLPGLVREEGDVNCRDWNGDTALRKAVWNGHEQCVKTLLQFEVSEETFYHKFDRPTLHLAAIKSHTKCIKHLLERGADVNFRDRGGQTALHASARQGDRECVTMLIKHGANVSCRDKRGNTALHLAAKHGNEESLLALIDGGADVEMLDGHGQTPLQVSAFWGHVACLSILLDRGANLSSQDECGNSALHIAAQNNQDEVLLALIQRGANVNSQNNEHRTPLHITAVEGHVPSIALLIQGGANLEIFNDDGLSALHVTSSLGHLVCILLLLEGGVNVNFCDREGLTALHHSCKSGFEECVSILLDNGADIDHGDKLGITALNIADSGGHVGCVDVLLQRGAKETWRDRKRRLSFGKKMNISHSEIRETFHQRK